jgi:RNA polymerase sigma-70 factor (ECF subfamily)
MPSSNSEPGGRNISQIETLWPILRQAHDGRPDEASAAQQAILQRYRQAIVRYLMACLRSNDAVDEVFQEFALRFIRGDFRNANPERGRFRDLLKTALYHLMVDFRKRQRRGEPLLTPESPEPVAADTSVLESDREFLEAWRSDLLNRAWDALAQEEQRTGRHLYTVLHFRASNPEMRSAQMAEHLTARLGKEVSADWVRKWLHAARDKFADFVLTEVSASLREPTLEAVEQELIDVELFEYCREALDRWRTRRSQPGD